MTVVSQRYYTIHCATLSSVSSAIVLGGGFRGGVAHHPKSSLPTPKIIRKKIIYQKKSKKRLAKLFPHTHTSDSSGQSDISAKFSFFLFNYWIFLTSHFYYYFFFYYYRVFAALFSLFFLIGFRTQVVSVHIYTFPIDNMMKEFAKQCNT